MRPPYRPTSSALSCRASSASMTGIPSLMLYARRHGRHTSSSSSFPSIEFLQEQGCPFPWNLGSYRKHPAIRQGKITTFYGILLGHQYRQVIAKLQILRAELMVIRKGMLNHMQAMLTQRGEKALRPSDTGHAMHGLSMPAINRAMLILRPQPPDIFTLEGHRKGTAQRQFRLQAARYLSVQ